MDWIISQGPYKVGQKALLSNVVKARRLGTTLSRHELRGSMRGDQHSNRCCLDHRCLRCLGHSGARDGRRQLLLMRISPSLIPCEIGALLDRVAEAGRRKNQVRMRRDGRPPPADFTGPLAGLLVRRNPPQPEPILLFLIMKGQNMPKRETGASSLHPPCTTRAGPLDSHPVTISTQVEGGREVQILREWVR